jgi:predicted DNA-binding ribbon-helix-helix protein
MPTTVKKRSVVVAGHRTSVSLEAAFWDVLREIAQEQSKTLNQLVSEIDHGRSGNLSSAIRVYVLDSVRAGKAPTIATEPQTPQTANNSTTH